MKTVTVTGETAELILYALVFLEANWDAWIEEDLGLTLKDYETRMDAIKAALRALGEHK